jgi:hypothetical protein
MLLFEFMLIVFLIGTLDRMALLGQLRVPVLSIAAFKGTVARDFQPLAFFFMNKPCMDLWVVP